MVKNSPANARDVRVACSITGSRKPPGGGHGKPLQYSYLENPMDRGALAGYSPQGRTELATNEAT